MLDSCHCGNDCNHKQCLPNSLRLPKPPKLLMVVSMTRRTPISTPNTIIILMGTAKSQPQIFLKTPISYAEMILLQAAAGFRSDPDPVSWKWPEMSKKPILSSHPWEMCLGSQRAQYPLIKEYTLNGTRVPDVN